MFYSCPVHSYQTDLKKKLTPYRCSSIGNGAEMLLCRSREVKAGGPRWFPRPVGGPGSSLAGWNCRLRLVLVYGVVEKKEQNFIHLELRIKDPHRREHH